MCWCYVARIKSRLFQNSWIQEDGDGPYTSFSSRHHQAATLGHDSKRHEVRYRHCFMDLSNLYWEGSTVFGQIPDPSLRGGPDTTLQVPVTSKSPGRSGSYIRRFFLIFFNFCYFLQSRTFLPGIDKLCSVLGICIYCIVIRSEAMFLSSL